MKRVIVTGANGFVGSYVVDELIKNGAEVWVVVKDKTDYNIPGGVKCIECDLSEMSDLDIKIIERGFDYFIHMAWDGVCGIERENYEKQLKNANACANAAMAAGKLGCRRFIGIGSITEKMYIPYILRDGIEPDMTMCYAVGKMAAQCISKCICEKIGIDFLWGYVANIYGKGDYSYNIINYMVNNYEKGTVPDLTDGLQKADFIYASDVASAIISMADSGKKSCSYYIGYCEPKPLKEFAKYIRDRINPDVETGLGRKKFKGEEIRFDDIDMKKLYRDTGFEPKVPFEEGLHKLLQWRGIEG